VEYRSEPTAFWRDRLDRNVYEVNAILRSGTFLERCAILPLERTNGKSVRQVCEEIACRGATTISVGFFHDTQTKAIAFEQEGMISLNTAREDAAGSAGNLAHEFAHQLGYTHVSTFEYLGARSVPYGIGYLVDRLARDLWAP
jgi:hypothetical protein